MTMMVLGTIAIVMKILSNARELLQLGGTTSLLELTVSDSTPTTETMKYKTILVGSKRGSLCSVKIYPDFSRVSTPQRLPAMGEVGARPFPVYSMATGDNTTFFCGGGDRYVSVWKRHQSTSTEDWGMVQRLGPHTGWVKDIKYTRNKLFSIGCNSIEAWEPAENDNWVHLSQSSIESDPRTGATLSNDLLCLACTANGRLVSGGVDGRLHQWEGDTMGAPEFSLSAHDGRVNALAVDCTQNILFSVGHDGCLKSWHRNNEGIEAIDIFRFGANVRVTSVTCWRNDGCETLSITVGDSIGRISFLSCGGDGNGFLLMDQISLANEPMVNKLLALTWPEAMHPTTVVVAHSLGVDLVACKRVSCG